MFEFNFVNFIMILRTILPHVHTNGGVGRRAGTHGSTRRPNVVEQKNWNGGKPENSEPSHSKNIGQEYKLKNKSP